MKIIFLDIDGVLNGYNIWRMLGWKISSFLHFQKWYRKHSRDPFTIHEEKVRRLSKIIKKTNAKIVMSSSWRGMWNIQYEDMTQNQKLLVDMLNKYNIEVIDITPFHPKRRRDREILSWLSKNQEKVDKFIILDDECSDLQCFIGGQLIQTSSIKLGEIIKGHWCENTGLKQKHVRKAIKILNSK